MGALTSKVFPFELRGWDIEKFESLDPTDAFGSNTKVYVSKNQVVLIEPDYDHHSSNTWLTDKGRQFFDGFFKPWEKKKELLANKSFWTLLLKKLTEIIYLANHCQSQDSKNHFFTIVFNDLSLEALSMLALLSQNYSFIKLRSTEKSKTNTDLESNFLLNNTSNKSKLSSSTLSLLISTNPRYEGYYLNLNLRQRVLKGNFKCLIIGSLIDLTFPVLSLGSNVQVLKTIAEGNSFICQDLKFAANPLLIQNTELSKRNDYPSLSKIINKFCYPHIFNKSWNGLGLLNPSLASAGKLSFQNINHLTLKDLNNFSSLYFLNTTVGTISNFKKITELKLLKSDFLSNQLILDQNLKANNNLHFSTKMLSNYLHLPSTTFYENEETFINAEGLLKRTTKLIPGKKTKNSWQVVRKFMKYFKQKLFIFQKNNKQTIFFNSKKYYNFKSFINFQYHAVQSLTHLNFYLTVRNKAIILNNNNQLFKTQVSKITNTKLKYWLDDFFTDGKDEYTQHSVTLINCSKILKSETTNFF